MRILFILALTACNPDKDTTDTASGDTPADTGQADSGTQDSADTSDTEDTQDTSDIEDTQDTQDSGTDSGQDSGGADLCAGLPICDDFESHTAGSAPLESDWDVVSPDCSGSGEIIVTDEHARSGTKSLKVFGGPNYCDHIFATPLADITGLGSVIHGRFWMRIENAFELTHVTFLTMHDSIEAKDLRMGGQSQILMWNRESDDATLPELSPTGIGLSHTPVTQDWFCVSFKVDTDAGTIDTFVDSQWIEGLSVDEEPTADIDRQWINQKPDWRPTLSDVKIGWEAYGGGANTLWFDDVAFSSSPIACD